MEILRDYKQISDRVNNIFGIDVTDVPLLDSLSDNSVKELLTTSTITKAENQVVSLAELIFQLNEYIPALCNLIKMFLHTGYYEAVVIFMEKLFVAHVGNVIYNSKNQEYSHKERFFDRFVEVIKMTDLKLQDILPFLFAIVEDENKTHLSAWQAPALEYLQNIFRENISDVQTFIANNPSHKKSYYTLGLEFNTQKTIVELFNQENSMDEAIFARLLKYYYTDTMSFFDKNLENAGSQKLHYVKILASIEKPEVTARLENLYNEETDEEIKSFIKSKLGISEQSNFGCAPQYFVVMAQKKVSNIQERSLGVPFNKLIMKFNDGTECDNLVKTYLINIFKERKDLINLSESLQLKELFESSGLDNFVTGIFSAVKRFKDIKEAKWAIRMISLLSVNESEQEVYDFVYDLFVQNRVKEAKYFMSCLIYSKKEKVIDLIYKLQEENVTAFIDCKDEFISLYSEVFDKKIEDVQMFLTSDEISEESLQIQKDKLFASFIAGKQYTKEQFNETFLNKKIFNELAQRLVFGEYKQNRLMRLFVVEGDQIRYIAGNAQDDDELTIKIAHSLDIDERFEDVKKYYVDPTFSQFSKQAVKIKESDKTLTKVSNLQGILINAIKFVTNLQKYGFIKNIANEMDSLTEMVHISSDLNILAEVCLETPINTYTSTSSIGVIRFYKLNQCLKNGNAYIVNKANAIALGGVEPRYYDFVVSSVSNSMKN